MTARIAIPLSLLGLFVCSWIIAPLPWRPSRDTDLVPILAAARLAGTDAAYDPVKIRAAEDDMFRQLPKPTENFVEGPSRGNYARLPYYALLVWPLTKLS